MKLRDGNLISGTWETRDFSLTVVLMVPRAGLVRRWYWKDPGFGVSGPRFTT